MSYYAIHLKAIALEMLMKVITKTHLQITHFEIKATFPRSHWVNQFLFCFRYALPILSDPSMTDVLTLLLVCVCSPEYIRNPYLTAKLVEVMFVLNPAVQRSTEKLNDRLINHPVALNHLVPALMKFYTEIETTGASSEFYDKFTIRYHISIIFKTLWDHPNHQERIVQGANTSQFVKFVNMLMNDTTFLLDESLDTLKSIRELQELMENKTEWNKQTRVRTLVLTLNVRGPS